MKDEKRKHRRALFILLAGGMLLCALLLLGEIAARMWLVYVKDVPAGRPDAIELAFYPELRAPLLTPIGPGDGHYDVLILAGSVMYDYYGAPALHLQEALERRGIRNVRVWNMGRPAHGTRDSLIKYRWLADKRFDWVVVYDGINELRANNIPDAGFRPDYSHIAWYAEVKRVAPGPRPPLWRALALPPFVSELRVMAGQAFHPALVPWDAPPSPELAVYGASIKTAASFGANLEAIARLARERGDPLTLATMASWLDPKYNQAALLHDRALMEKNLPGAPLLSYARPNYADFAQPCEIWGRPEDIVKGLAVHNDETRRVAGETGAALVDVAATMPAEGREFIDICHLSPAGVKILVDTLAAAAPHDLREK